MSASEAQEVVRRFFRLFSQGDAPAAAALVDEGVVWWVQGRGTLDKAALVGAHAGMVAATESRRMDLIGEIAQDDRVAVELDVEMKFQDGRTMANTMHIAFTVRNGRIVAAREYMDTAAARAFMAGSGISEH